MCTLSLTRNVLIDGARHATGSRQRRQAAQTAKELSTEYAPVSVKAAAQCFLKVVVGLVRAGWGVGVACDRDFF